MLNILPDYHIHTKLCNHATGEMEEYVEKAISMGLKEIGFSDHMPVMPEPHLCMTYEQLPGYIKSVTELQQKYAGEIMIKLGCEMDIVLDRKDEIKRITETYPFDYVIGSIHYLDGWPFDQEQYISGFEKESIFKIYEKFFKAISMGADTGLYDIVGHIDNIKCMGHRPKENLDSLYHDVALVLKEKNLAFELNTSGFDKSCKEQFPSEEFLKVLRENEIPVTFGSDSHKPESVGRYFKDGLEIIRNAGYEKVAFFEKRNIELRTII